MHARYAIVLGFAIALSGGCAHSKKNPTTQPIAQAAIEQSETMSLPALSVATDNLAGDWQLAIPRQFPQQASITASEDGKTVKIEAGETLSGTYVVHGDFLLILTHDETMQTLAWKINSPDSLTVVRSPTLGDGAVNYTGFTLLRAPADVTADLMMSESSATDSSNSNSSDADSSDSDSTTSTSEEAEADGDELLGK
jgi:hypothetical protein